jgi:predicted nucleotidyltransferase
MNAKSIIVKIAKALAEVKLNAILIGNAGAALQGAPVTTMGFDFFIDSNNGNYDKIKKIAEILNAQLEDSSAQESSMKSFHLKNEAENISVDFISHAHDIKSFNDLKSHSNIIEFDGQILRIASLDDIIASKKAAARPTDKALFYTLELALSEKKNPGPIEKIKISENVYRVDMDPDLHSIRLWQSLPPNQRTGFLRVKLPNGGSCL